MLNPDRFFGRVAYTYGHGVDQLLGVTRLGYQDAADPRAVFAVPAFTLSPLWNHRGQAENGAFDDGARARCVGDGTGGTRCVEIAYPEGWFPYNKQFYVPVAWHGTLIEEKRDKAGTLYRRARVYDPATGQFTQEDPIGLAGGLNLYGFASGDPVNFSDPFGLCPKGKPCPDELELMKSYVNFFSELFNTVSGAYLFGALERGVGGMGVAAEEGAIAARAAVAAERDVVIGASETRVTRWMSEAEYKVMKSTGVLQTGAGNRSYVTLLGAPRPTVTRDAVRVNFNVPTRALQPAGDAQWRQILDPHRVPITGIVRQSP